MTTKIDQLLIEFSPIDYEGFLIWMGEVTPSQNL